MFPQCFPEWQEESSFFFSSFGLFIAPIFFSYSSTWGKGWGAPEKALFPWFNFMDRKFHSPPLWMLRISYNMTWGWALKMAWSPLWNKTGWKELCGESQTLYGKGSKLLKVPWKSTDLFSRAVNVKTYSKSISYSDIKKGELSHWCLFHPQCVYLDQFMLPNICFLPASLTALASG